MSRHDPLPWIVHQTKDSLELCHDHRWLRIVGIPLIAIGIIAAVAIWFIPHDNWDDAWPMLAVGSLFGLAIAIAGLHLSLNRVGFIAQLPDDRLLHYEGFGPLLRKREFRLSQVQHVRATQIVDAGSPGPRYALILIFPNQQLRLAIFVERDPILIEALRWSEFLNKPLDDQLS